MVWGENLPRQGIICHHSLLPGSVTTTKGVLTAVIVRKSQKKCKKVCVGSSERLWLNIILHSCCMRHAAQPFSSSLKRILRQCLFSSVKDCSRWLFEASQKQEGKEQQ